jgi:tetratricopeptide (TPR) repeat protein
MALIAISSAPSAGRITNGPTRSSERTRQAGSFTKADLPQDWAMTLNNLGTALQALGTLSGGEEGRKLLEDAVVAYRSSLEVFTKADRPQDWAMTLNNLGKALQELGTLRGGEEGRELLAAAAAAYRSSLEVFTKADRPWDWAMTHYNLGGVLGTLGSQLEGEEGLKRLREIGGIASGSGGLSTGRSVTLSVGVCAWWSCLRPDLK